MLTVWQFETNTNKQATILAFAVTIQFLCSILLILVIYFDWGDPSELYEYHNFFSLFTGEGHYRDYSSEWFEVVGSQFFITQLTYIAYVFLNVAVSYYFDQRRKRTDGKITQANELLEKEVGP